MTDITILPAAMHPYKHILDENKRLREALEDIYQHSAKPFIGVQWNNYAHHVAFQALKPTQSTVQETK